MKTKLMPTVHKDKEAEGVYSLVLKCATSCKCTSVITVHQGWIRKVTVSGRQAFLSPCLKNKKGRGQVNKNQYVALVGSKPHRVLTHRCTHHLHLDEVSVSCDFLCLSPTSSKSRKTITGKTIYKIKPRGTASTLLLPPCLLLSCPFPSPCSILQRSDWFPSPRHSDTTVSVREWTDGVVPNTGRGTACLFVTLCSSLKGLSHLSSPGTRFF